MIFSGAWVRSKVNDQGNKGIGSRNEEKESRNKERENRDEGERIDFSAVNQPSMS
jgi:hypothetical protein